MARNANVFLDRTSIPGAGGIALYFSNSHSFLLRVGLGHGKNNFPEIMSLKLLLFAIEKKIRHIQIFRDSQLIVNWFNDVSRFNVHTFGPIPEEIFMLKQSFDYISVSHIYKYRERNGGDLYAETVF